MQNMLWVFLGICAAIVLSAIGEYVMIWLLRPSQRRFTVTLLPITGEGIDLERQLRWQYYCLQCHSCRGGERLLLVDCGATEQALGKAEMFCRDKPGVMLCTKEQLRRIIQNDAVYKAVEIVLY